MAREKKKIRAFKQLDIICGIVPEEINLFKQISGSSAQGRIFYPANIEYLIGCIGVDAEKLTFRGNNILLGNSANFSNNHLDLLSVLSGIKHKIPEGCKIYCPLGYGSSFVRSTVARKGSRLFKQQFTPVNEFIPLEEYRDLIATCSAMLMYHHKQAALGTVLIGLWFGIKVYLSKVNPVFPYLMENGVTVFSIEHDLKDFDMEAPLTKARVDHTRENLMRLFGREAALTNTKLLVQMAYSRHIQT
jgi:dTDP-N-acetylfucosamine:lipid II N-acetylfucosaminyltransferase